jgi:phage terminase large subunit-like protein
MKVSLTYTAAQEDYFFSPENEGKRFVLMRKGRRLGATQGAAFACIEWGLQSLRVLWGDTVHGNIDRYVDRYFKPALTKNNIAYSWSKQAKTLIFEKTGGTIDFRSADNPENWEGFGYHRIFLNEAGIILKNPYLWTNAVLPMMMDFVDAKLFAAGVPKGKYLKDGKEHPFYTLFKQVDIGNPQYRGLAFSSYDNPFLREEDVKALQEEISRMNPSMVAQEIKGEFVEAIGDALFSVDSIESNRVGERPALQKIVIAIDPATTTGDESDETGIIVAGATSGMIGYLLEDCSGKYTPNEWASKVAALWAKYSEMPVQLEIVAETNQGGDMVTEVLKVKNRLMRVATVHAKKGKITRAEPVAELYAQGRCKHVGNFTRLEFQMTTFDGAGKSPDRLDAMVYAFHRLLIKGKMFVAV